VLAINFLPSLLAAEVEVELEVEVVADPSRACAAKMVRNALMHDIMMTALIDFRSANTSEQDQDECLDHNLI
jgi:hypothetical protein